MYAVAYAREMHRCIKRVRKRGYDMSKLDDVLQLLSDGKPLYAPAYYCVDAPPKKIKNNFVFWAGGMYITGNRKELIWKILIY